MRRLQRDFLRGRVGAEEYSRQQRDDDSESGHGAMRTKLPRLWQSRISRHRVSLARNEDLSGIGDRLAGDGDFRSIDGERKFFAHAGRRVSVAATSGFFRVSFLVEGGNLISTENGNWYSSRQVNSTAGRRVIPELQARPRRGDGEGVLLPAGVSIAGNLFSTLQSPLHRRSDVGVGSEQTG